MLKSGPSDLLPLTPGASKLVSRIFGSWASRRAAPYEGSREAGTQAGKQARR